MPTAAALTRANLQLLILASMQALAEMNDHCPPTEALKPLVMSAVQEELSLFLLDWLQDARSGALQPASALNTTAAGSSGPSARRWTGVGWPYARRPEPTAAHIAALLTDGLANAV